MPRDVSSCCSPPGWLGAIRACPRIAALCAGIISFLCFVQAPLYASDTETGQAIYKEECARCHGPAGEGTKKTTRSLAGDKSPFQLARFIQRAMPDDDPGSCSAEECQKIASYIYDAFYSRDAQARLNPPRVALSHLTVTQYRGTVADLIDSFRYAANRDARHGLRGKYTNSRDARTDKTLIDRIDPEINFDFGTSGPATGSSSATFNPDQFSVRWDGSVFAEETGNYDFVVRTEQALRLWVNDPVKPAIDGIIKSGSDTEFRASIFLIAGRSYPIRLEIYKGRQLNPKKKTATKPEKESVALFWRLPQHQVDELIPSRCLSPGQSPEVAVIQTPFPPDDRSYGWERGTAVSKEWFSATTDAALDVAGYVSAHLVELSHAAEDSKDRVARLRAFCATFAERALRRPLTDIEKQQLVDRQFEAGHDLEVAVKRSIIRVMMSPEFLYPETAAGPAGYSTASRLALVLWDSLPDQTLITAAAKGQLATPEQIAAQAQRMIDDPRARLKVRQFLLAWLRVDQPPELVKDTKKFPDFDPAVASDLRTSLELFLDDVVSSEGSDFRQLLLGDDLFLNGRLAKFYGAELPADAEPPADWDFIKMKLEPGQRAGVLTHPYMMSAFAYPGESSPIHRGVFIIRGILGVTLQPPANAAFVPLSSEQHPDLTTRERITLQTSPEACASCHSLINSLGFTLEKFDSVGRFRESENGKPVDVSGHYETRAGSTANFSGARELANFLANSEESHDAFAQQMFQQLVKQPVRAFGLEKPAELRDKFAKSGFNIRKLIVEIAMIAVKPS